MNVTDEEIRYPAQDGFPVGAFLARPEGEPKGALLLVQHLWGVDDNLRDVARRLAAQGYVTLAPRLYSRHDLERRMDPKRIGAVMGILFRLPPQVQRDPEQVAAHLADQSEQVQDTGKAVLEVMRGHYREGFVQDLVAGAQFLRREHPQLPLGALGFCMGGGLAARVAVEVPELAACVIFYGEHPPLDRVGEIQAAVLGLYGGEDRRITDAVPAFAEAMSRAGKSFTYHVYPGAQHAFFDDTRPAHHPAAAADAWPRVKDFLREHLG
ncbi:MAG: dienelactone hydrolase family protein [Thermaerobacter sp.]|jgi:carboxymethylenebutenolidase|nr:dienelactone hydrolase family protein [Thermaerobacter sp.]